MVKLHIMEKQLLDDSVHNLWILLHQTRDIIFRAREKELRPYGITPIHAGVLLVITVLGGKTNPSEIARWMVRKPHTISGYISRMVLRGLVKTEYSKGKVIVTITPKGKQLYKELYVDTAKREVVNKIFSCLSEEEQQQLRSMLDRLRKRGFNSLHSVEIPPFP